MKINIKFLALLCLLHLLLRMQAPAQHLKDLPFFVFNNGLKDEAFNTPEKQVTKLVLPR